MPALPPAIGVIKFAVRQTLGDDLDVLNLFHISTQLAGTPADAADLMTGATEMATIFAARFSPQLGGDNFLTAVTAKDIGVANGAEATHVVSPPVQGGTGGGDFPANVALCVSWKEPISYRGGHPRTYLSAVPRSAGSDPQHVTGAYATAVQTAANGFISDIAAGTWPGPWGTPELVVVHYTSGGVPLTPPHLSAITSALVNTRMDSQRRRLQA